METGYQTAGSLSPMAGIIFGIGIFLLILLMLVTMWKIFTKAGHPGWASIVPIYNVVIMLKIASKPLWWILLLFIPFVNFIAIIMLYIAMAKSFKKSAGFGIGMIVLPFIFFPILAFGDAQYAPQQA